MNDIVNQMQHLGDQVSESLVARKVLRSLGPKYNFVVAVIGEANDLTKLTMDEFAWSLQTHEHLLLSQDEAPTEKAFVIGLEKKTFVTKGE